MYFCMRWAKEVSTSLSFCFPLLVIILKYFNCSSWYISSGVTACLKWAFNIFDKKYQRTLSSQQMPFHNPSFNIHFSSLSIHDMIKIDTYETEYETYIQQKHCLLHNQNSEFGGGIWNTCWRLIPWWNCIKICCFTTFRVGCFVYRIFCFLFVHYYILKSVFCWDISVSRTRVWSMWRNLSGNTVETQRRTVSKFHPNLSLFCGGIHQSLSL